MMTMKIVHSENNDDDDERYDYDYDYKIIMQLE